MKGNVTDVMDWAIPDWCPEIVMPLAWVEENGLPDERGPFHVIHCGNHDTALHVCELLNEDVERVIRAEAR